MPTWTRAAYLATLRRIAERIRSAVYDEGPDELVSALEVARNLKLPDDDSLTLDIALAVLLAAATDRRKTLDQLLHWTRVWPDGVAALLPPSTASPAPREATPPEPRAPRNHMRERRLGPHLRPLFVERCIAGRISAAGLTSAEKDRAIRILHGRGMSDRGIAARMGAGDDFVRGRRIKLGLPVNPQPHRETVRA